MRYGFLYCCLKWSSNGCFGLSVSDGVSVGFCLDSVLNCCVGGVIAVINLRCDVSFLVFCLESFWWLDLHCVGWVFGLSGLLLMLIDLCDF